MTAFIAASNKQHLFPCGLVYEKVLDPVNTQMVHPSCLLRCSCFPRALRHASSMAYCTLGSIFDFGHVSTMSFIVCHWPQSQEDDWARPQLCKLARNGPGQHKEI